MQDRDKRDARASGPGPEKATGGAGGAPGAAEGAAGAAVGASEAATTDGGWRSQSPWLKLVLLASLAFIVIGVYRCSTELAPSQGERSIRVEPATAAVPDSLLAASPDSLAALATRMFARGLREASGVEVLIGGDAPAWAAVRLHLRPAPEGRIELVGTASSVLGGRRMADVAVTDTPHMLREMAASASRELAERLDLTSEPAAGER